MKRILIALTVFAAFASTMTGPVTATSASAALRPEVLRRVYFSAVDGKGVQVTDLTAAELTVKEGGKERAIAEVKPATTPMHVSLFVDDAGQGAFQVAVAQFFQTLLNQAKFAVSIMNPQPIKVADYTADPSELRAALGRMGQRGKVDVDGEQIVDAVGGAAKELQQLKAGRPVIVVLSASGEAAVSNQSDNALNSLRASGASLHVAVRHQHRAGEGAHGRTEAIRWHEATNGSWRARRAGAREDRGQPEEPVRADVTPSRTGSS